MRAQATISIDVTVFDFAMLRTYALKRALDAGFTEHEFEDGIANTPETKLHAYLLWVFDNGSPADSGLQIESSDATVHYFNGAEED